MLAVMVALVACACDRSTSVGAAGRRSDAATDADAGADTDAGDDAADADGATPTAEELCLASGGTLTTASCCLSAPASFPDTCAIGACSCAPANSRTIPTCDCPGGCFSPGVGCVAR
ncbi:MAG TPA: hypothetical protein VIU64_04330 [Polyangia bacterium]